MQLWKDGCQLLVVVYIYNGCRRGLSSTIASKNIYLLTFFTSIFLLTQKMATIIATTKATSHVRSISLPSRSHPLTLDVEAQLDRLRSSQQTSSSSACQKLSGMKDLFDSIDDLLQLPVSVQALSDEQNCRSVEYVLGGSLGLLDACNTTKDIFTQLKDCVKELESSLRRKRGGESSLSGEIEAYRVTRKNLKQVITKTLRNMKAMEKKNVLDSSSVAIFCMLKDVEEVSSSVFASVLSSISSSMGISKQGGWSLVSKLLQPKRVTSKREFDASEVVNMDTELLSLKSNKNISPEQVQNVLQGLQFIESSLQEIEEEMDCVYRKLEVTNQSLLLKWCWKLANESQSLWKELVMELYAPKFTQEGFILQRGNASHVWKSILSCCNGEIAVNRKIREQFSWQVGNGELIDFWFAPWCGQNSLQYDYPRLFSLAENKQAKASEVGEFVGGLWQWKLIWRRCLFAWEEQQAAELEVRLRRFQLREGRTDRMVWGTAAEEFTVKRCKFVLEQLLLPESHQPIPNVWSRRGAPKNQALLWLACHGKLTSKSRLVQMRLIDSEDTCCPRCGEEEKDADHIILNCKESWLSWSDVLSKWGFTWVVPRSVGDLFVQWEYFACGTKQKEIWYVILFSTAWGIWLARNERIFKQSMRSPKVISETGLRHSLNWAKFNLRGSVPSALDVLPIGNLHQVLR